MTDRPILFSTPMVRALLDGRKTQTRRVLKEQPPTDSTFFAWDIGPYGRFARFLQREDDLSKDLPAPRLPYWIGDRLWVRESYHFDQKWDDCRPSAFDRTDAIKYEADGNCDLRFWGSRFNAGKLRPSMFMPKWASRLTLIVTDVRVQRLQDISEADAIAEGIYARRYGDGSTAFGWESSADHITPRTAYNFLWNSINGPNAWDANPWVVAVNFDVVRQNIDQMPKGGKL